MHMFKYIENKYTVKITYSIKHLYEKILFKKLFLVQKHFMVQKYCVVFFFFFDQKNKKICVVWEVGQLEVRVSDGDPPQLHYLRVAHAAPVVASRDGLVVADVKASSWKTQRNQGVAVYSGTRPSSVLWHTLFLSEASKLLLPLDGGPKSNPP